jgi:hypothetical protein
LDEILGYFVKRHQILSDMEEEKARNEEQIEDNEDHVCVKSAILKFMAAAVCLSRCIYILAK